MSNPTWFDGFVNQPISDHYLRSDGAKIHYQTWQSDATQALLFVHGHGAHAHWWDFIAPALSAQFRTAAMDLSGYGDSEHRTHYTARAHAHEIATIAKQLGDNTIVIGHSFGGAMTRIAAYLFPESMQGFVLVDSILSTQRSQRPTPPMPRIKRRVYQDLTTAKRRFRLRPAQRCDNEYIIDHIAAHSFKTVSDGYEFKLDQAVFAKMQDYPGLQLPDAVTMIKACEPKKACIYGLQSRFYEGAKLSVLESIFGEGQVKAIDHANHHVFLDQPLVFIETLKQLLQCFNK